MDTELRATAIRTIFGLLQQAYPHDERLADALWDACMAVGRLEQPRQDDLRATLYDISRTVGKFS